MRLLGRSAWVIGLLGFAGLGCSSGGDSSAEVAPQDNEPYVDLNPAKSDGLSPVDTENVGFVKVVEPTDLGGATMVRYSLELGGRSIQAGTRYRLPAGHYCVTLGTESTGYSIPPFTTRVGQHCFDLAVQAAETVQLAAVRMKHDVKRFQVDAGPVAKLAFLFNSTPVLQKALSAPMEFDDNYSDALGPLRPLKNENVAYAFLPGSYELRWTPEALGTHNETKMLEPGQFYDWYFDFDERSAVTIKAPEVSLADYGTGTYQNRHVIGHRMTTGLGPDSQGLGERFAWGQDDGWASHVLLDQPFTRDATVHLYPLSEEDQQAGEQYIHFVNNTWRPLEVNPAQSIHIDACRMEIDDVSVTQPDTGATYKASATYQVYAQTQEGWRIVPSWKSGTSMQPLVGKTPSGIDLVPGTYRFELRYQTSEGQRKQLWQCNMHSDLGAGKNECVKVEEQ